jgi:formylglycine-generating enzyme required for sulfatase activity
VQTPESELEMGSKETSHSLILTSGKFTRNPSGKVNFEDVLELIHIPAGDFLYGETKEKIFLPEYWISKTPVTQAQYQRFITANPEYDVPYYDFDWAKPYNWDRQYRTFPQDKADHPVVLVSWHDAMAFCEWAGLRLPTEEEWEQAARGTDGRGYPWGNGWRSNHCNSEEAVIRGTSRVGEFSPRGDSPYGCVDMSGNVWEWTDSWYDEKQTRRVVRGGSWDFNQYYARAASRYPFRPVNRSNLLGLRAVLRRSPSQGH